MPGKQTRGAGGLSTREQRARSRESLQVASVHKPVKASKPTKPTSAKVAAATMAPPSPPKRRALAERAVPPPPKQTPQMAPPHKFKVPVPLSKLSRQASDPPGSVASVSSSSSLSRLTPHCTPIGGDNTHAFACGDPCMYIGFDGSKEKAELLSAGPFAHPIVRVDTGSEGTRAVHTRWDRLVPLVAANEPCWRMLGGLGAGGTVRAELCELVSQAQGARVRPWGSAAPQAAMRVAWSEIEPLREAEVCSAATPPAPTPTHNTSLRLLRAPALSLAPPTPCVRQLRTLRQLEPLQPEELSEIRNGGSLDAVKAQRKRDGRRHRRGELAMLREEDRPAEAEPAAPTGERKRKTRGASCAAELPTLAEEEAPKGKRRQSTRLL